MGMQNEYALEKNSGKRMKKDMGTMDVGKTRKEDRGVNLRVPELSNCVL